MGKGANSKKPAEEATINIHQRKMLQQLEREEQERTAPPPKAKDKEDAKRK